MKLFTIQEWKHLHIGNQPEEIEEYDARRIHKLAELQKKRLKSPTILTRTARPSLQAGQVVGILATPSVSVEILPKIDGENDKGKNADYGAVRNSLVHMLAVVQDIRVADIDSARMSTQHNNILEILVRLFVERLRTTVKRGLPHRYRIQEDDLPLLRGKLNFPKQMVRQMKKSTRLSCIFDELTVDTPLNRVLKAAVQRLLDVSNNPENRRQLLELVARFEFVSDSVRPQKEPVQLDRTNTAFHRLYHLAKLFLSGEWQNTASGKFEGFGLLFPMNVLFEEYIRQSFKLELCSDRVRKRFDRFALKERPEGREPEKLFGLKPDIVINNNIVVDTKWKKLNPTDKNNKHGVLGADVYQMLAYSRAYRAKRLILLYPWHAGLNEKSGIYKRWLVAGSDDDIPFDIATVDVGNPKSVRETLRAIIESD